jgi:hypothetical protein
MIFPHVTCHTPPVTHTHPVPTCSQMGDRSAASLALVREQIRKMYDDVDRGRCKDMDRASLALSDSIKDYLHTVDGGAPSRSSVMTIAR